MIKRFHILFFALLLLITACDEAILFQDLSKIFKDGVPKMLETIRNPLNRLSLQQKEHILERIKKDEKRTDLIEVAVIDSGVDITHPDLIDQIKYEIRDGKIIGSGVDLLGKTPFASNYFVDPTLFAFGAKEVDYLQIKGAQESPIQLMRQIDEKFKALVLSKIANDPILNKSVFANITRDSFTVFRFLKISEEAKDHLEDYNQNLKENSLITTEDLNNPIDANVSGNKKMAIQRLASSSLYLNENGELPEIFSYLSQIQGGDRLINILLESFEQINMEFNFTENINKIGIFKTAKNNITFSEKDIKDNTESYLGKRIPFILWGYHAIDPIKRIRKMFDEVPMLKGKGISEGADIIFNYYQEKLSGLLQSQDLPPNLAQKLKKKGEKEKMSEGLSELRQLLKTFGELENNPIEYKKVLSQLRRTYVHDSHVFLAKETLNNEHGTHVSGIIAAQDPRIRIVPVRATVQTVDLPESTKKELSEAMLDKVLKWMELPIAQELRSMIASEYGKKSISDTTLKSELKKYLKANTLNLVFINDLFNAIEEVGTRNIKLANISLGTVFKKTYNDKKSLSSIAEDIFAEFVRYEAGVRLVEKAPNTLFLIATGNDGDWVDGVSKTAFPVGITSLRARKLSETLKLPPTPNNIAKNILAVGSVNSNRNLTEFTNILIDPHVPTIFSTGESITSSVPGLKDEASEGLAADLAMKYIKAIALIGLADLSKQEKLSFDKKLDAAMENIKFNFINELYKELGVLAHAQYPIKRAKMSGTSMATPTATGLIAKMALKFENPNSITPEELITLAFKSATRDELSRSMTIETLVENISKMPEDKNERKTKLEVKKWFLPPNRTIGIKCQQALLGH